MHSLSTWEFMAGMLAFACVCLFIVLGFCLHLKSIVNDIIRDEKANLRRWADNEAEIMASERTKEILSNVEVTFPVSLVNESDLNWGDDKDE